MGDGRFEVGWGVGWMVGLGGEERSDGYRTSILVKKLLSNLGFIDN